jgi:hypothetical protein
MFAAKHLGYLSLIKSLEEEELKVNGGGSSVFRYSGPAHIALWIVEYNAPIVFCTSGSHTVK